MGDYIRITTPRLILDTVMNTSLSRSTSGRTATPSLAGKLANKILAGQVKCPN
jgi:hypothetical protein